MSAGENVPQTSVHLTGSGNTLLYFSGPPQAVTGVIPLVNTSSETQRIRSIAISSEQLRSTGGQPLSEIPFRLRLRGGQHANVRARLPLDPQTPPGNYDFKVTMGPRTLSGTACIPEVVNLTSEPQAITIIASPKKSSYTRTIVCENNGNVVLPLGSRCEVPIIETDSLLGAILAGLNKGDRSSTDSMVKSALNELADLAVGTLVIERKAIFLSPGTKMAVDLEFQIPEGLKPQHHYFVPASLYNGSLKIDIYTTSKPDTKPDSKPEHRPNETTNQKPP